MIEITDNSLQLINLIRRALFDHITNEVYWKPKNVHYSDEDYGPDVKIVHKKLAYPGKLSELDQRIQHDANIAVESFSEELMAVLDNNIGFANSYDKLERNIALMKKESWLPYKSTMIANYGVYKDIEYDCHNHTVHLDEAWLLIVDEILEKYTGELKTLLYKSESDSRGRGIKLRNFSYLVESLNKQVCYPVKLARENGNTWFPEEYIEKHFNGIVKQDSDLFGLSHSKKGTNFSSFGSENGGEMSHVEKLQQAPEEDGQLLFIRRATEDYPDYFSERIRKYLDLCLKGQSRTEIADELGLTGSAVSKIRKDALKLLNELFEKFYK